MPAVASLAELNAMVERWDEADDERRIGSRSHTVGEHFAIEQPLLAPLPDEPFETGRLFTPRVDRFAQVTVRMNRYSVPVRLIGRKVRVLAHANELVIFDGRRELAAMYEFFERVGMEADIAGLRRDYPEAGWTHFERWAAAQDWRQLR